MRDALNDFKERIATGAQLPTSVSADQVKNGLENVLKQEKEEVEKLEAQKAELAKLPKRRARIEMQRAENASTAFHMTNLLLEELKRLEKSWLKPFSNVLK